MDASHSIVVANQLRHHVLTWDGGGSTTVLCLHGFLDSAWGFAQTAPRLAEAGFHVVAVDLRGHGDTEWVKPGGNYHFFDYVFDVADLAEAVSRDRLAIVGHSMGGAIASLYGASFPERPERIAIMEGLIIHEQPLEEMPERTAQWITSVRRLRQRLPKRYPSVEAAAERIRANDPRCPPEVALEAARHGTRAVEGGVVFKHDPTHQARGPHPFRTDHWRSYWTRVRCPTLLVDGGESEASRPPDYEARLAAFPHGRRVIIPEAGHMMMRHRPAEVAAALLDFLGEKTKA
jgi:pimeloyl-ACP methyl ester carboxylesterase